MTRLFEQVARPQATAQTIGAFLGGLRVMAIDGTVLDVPDSIANARVFGYPASRQGTRAAFPKAIALVEGLAQRLPQDPEVRSWQAIAYQRWGSKLVNDQQFDKARIYLKKALKTDLHNRSLWSEVDRDFRRMEKNF